MKKTPESKNQKKIRVRIVKSLKNLTDQIAEKKVIIGSNEFTTIAMIIWNTSCCYVQDVNITDNHTENPIPTPNGSEK